MALEHISDFPPPRHEARKEKRPSRRLHFPSELPLDEHVAETKRHLEARTTLYLLLAQTFKDFTIGSDQFIYYDRTNPKKCLAPDAFVKLGSRVADFDSWKTWRRGIPDLAVEIVSSWDRLSLTWEEKFERYQATGIRELVRFDPTRDNPIQIWDRVGSVLIERNAHAPNARKCKTLDLYWTVDTHPEFGPQLRLARDVCGNDLLSTPNEELVRLEQELSAARTAHAEAEHARVVAEHDKRVAEQEKVAIEQEKLAIEQEKVAIEQEKLAIEQEKLAIEQKHREEAGARARAEEQRRAAEERQRIADEQRRAAETQRQATQRKQRAALKKQREEAEARARAEAEVKRLREELEQLRRSR